MLNVADASLALEQTCNNNIDTQVENKLNFELLDDPLNLHRVAANETTLISEIPGIIDEDNIINFKQTFASDADFIFFARSIVEQHHFKFSINISMQKVRGMQITAGTVKQNYKESVKRLLSSENAYSFMSYVKGTPGQWRQFLFEVLAMVKQLGIPTYFLTLSCADLRWDELPYIINKLNNLGLKSDSHLPKKIVLFASLKVL